MRRPPRPGVPGDPRCPFQIALVQIIGIIDYLFTIT